ncbi:alpha/beta fold hydrolase, partial [Vibrio parahaemolyticus]
LFQQIRQLTPYYLNAVASDLPRLTVPTSIIWGERDSVMPVKLGQRLNRAIPGSTLTVIPGAGHLILNDAGPQVGKALADFLG